MYLIGAASKLLRCALLEWPASRPTMVAPCCEDRLSDRTVTGKVDCFFTDMACYQDRLSDRTATAKAPDI